MQTYKNTAYMTDYTVTRTALRNWPRTLPTRSKAKIIRQVTPVGPHRPTNNRFIRLQTPMIGARRRQASKFVKIHGSKLLLVSLRAGSKTVFVVANVSGFERPRPIHSLSYSGSVCLQVCYKVINIIIYGRRSCILVG